VKSESITLSAVIPATPEQIYDAWLHSKGHSAMTGSPATATARVGGAFTAWDGYIRGKNLELERGKRIVQAWRSTEFPKDAPDSRLEVLLAPASRGTRVTLKHSEIPAGQSASYKQGWKDFYFVPMKKHFAKKG
jgi:activator of HSP90 ATPase